MEKRRVSLISVMMILVSFVVLVSLISGIMILNQNRLEEITQRVIYKFDLLWERCVDSVKYYNRYEAIGKDKDGNIMVLRKTYDYSAGYAIVFYTIEKYDPSGEELIFAKRIDYISYIDHIYFNEDGSFLVTGEYYYNPHGQVVNKYDSECKLVWTDSSWDNLFSDLESNDNMVYMDLELNNVTKNAAGNYLIAGNYYLEIEREDEYLDYCYGILVVYDENGNQIDFIKISADANASEMKFEDAISNQNGTVVIGSILNKDTYQLNGIVYSIDEGGNVKWKQVYNTNENSFKDIAIDDDGNYFIVAQTEEYPIILKYDTDGNKIGEQIIANDELLEVKKVKILNNDKIIVVGNDEESVLMSILDKELLLLNVNYYQFQENKTNISDFIINDDYTLFIIGEVENHEEDEKASKKDKKLNGMIAKISPSMDIIVTKKWEDYDNKLKTRPENIIVGLKNNDEVIVEKTISTTEDMNVKFTGLPLFDEAGNHINYTVTELEESKGDLENYSAQIDQENYTIVNQYQDEVENVPTSDMNIWLYIVISIIAIVVIIIVIVMIVRGKKNHK
ncbi:MAG: Cna B-type domain-containing protein [Clostridia bacterium]|nr:Cna B-type domain-containing protein [Clostridia bacterium]